LTLFDLHSKINEIDLNLCALRAHFVRQNARQDLSKTLQNKRFLLFFAKTAHAISIHEDCSFFTAGCYRQQSSSNPNRCSEKGRRMVSRVIQNSAALLGEDLLTMEQVRMEALPVQISESTLQRHLRQGLESIRLFGRRYSSRQAVERFLQNQCQTEEERSTPPKRGSKTKREIEEAARRFGLLEPNGAARDRNKAEKKANNGQQTRKDNL